MCMQSTKGGFLAIQAVAAVLFLILIASLALALGADTKALKPSVLDKLSAKACNAMYQGRKMLHCCGISNHEPWDFAWLVRSSCQSVRGISPSILYFVQMPQSLSWLPPSSCSVMFSNQYDTSTLPLCYHVPCCGNSSSA